MNWFTCSGGPILDRPILKLFPPVLLICFLLGIGCTEPFDSVRNPGPKLTLGEELYRVFCQRLAVQSFPADFTGELTSSTCLFGEEPPSDAAPAFKTLHSRRPKLIRAFELVLADSVGTDMNELLQKLVPLYDQGIVQAQAHAVGDFAQLMSESALVLEGLEWVSNRDGYRPVEVANGLAAPLLDYPNMSQFLDTFLNTVFSTDDLRPIWNVLARSLGGELRSRAGEPEMIDKDFQRLLSDFLLWEDSRFSEGRRLFAVQRDPRGVVRVSGETAADWEVGFADTDFDGNPDVDQWGRFTDSQGEVLGFGSPFPSENSSASDSRDNHGRLMNQAGGYVYRYFDSLNTTTAGVLHEATRLIDYDPELPLELMAGIGPWLGERSDKTLTLEDGTQLPYLGVNTSTSPILDFVHASTFLLNSSEVISLSELLLNIVKEEPILLAKNVDVVRDLVDRLDVSPFNEIELNASHQLMDELLVILKEIALVPGLLEDLVSALGSEKGRKLGDYFGRYMKYRDKVDVSMGEGADINGPPVTSSPSGSNTTFSYAHLVDRSQNDNFDNRSLFHRFTHLIADTSGARFCNREGAKLVVQLGGLDLEYPLGRPEGFKKCELFDIPDMAEFYIQVLLGTGELKFKDDLLETFADLGGVASDSILESFSGIEGFTKRPTPMAVNRAMFGERNDFLNGIFDDPRTIDGTSLRERHPATIFAWEEPGFVDSMLPVLGVLAKYEKESILGRVFKVLASHWYSSESDMNQRIMSEGGEALKATGLVQYEEVLGSWLEEVKPLAVVTDLVNYLANVQVGDKKGNEVLGAFLRRASAPGYSGARLRPERSGVLLGDGSEAIFETVTPVDLFLDGWRRYEGYRLESDTSLINRLSKVVLYRLLAAKKSGEEIVGFQSEYGAALFERGLEVLIQELRQEQGNGTLDSYVDDWVDEARSLIEKPYFGASVDLMAQIGNSAEASAAFRDFVLYLLNAENSNASFDTLLVTLTDGVQLLRDETAVRATLLAFGELLDSPSSAVDKTIDFMLESKGYDEKDAVVALIRKLLTASVDDTQVPLDIFWDSIAGVCRIDPSKTAPRDRADFKEILTDVSAFIYDEDRGLERLFQIVQNRAK